MKILIVGGIGHGTYLHTDGAAPNEIKIAAPEKEFRINDNLFAKAVPQQDSYTLGLFMPNSASEFIYMVNDLKIGNGWTTKQTAELIASAKREAEASGG